MTPSHARLPPLVLRPYGIVLTSLAASVLAWSLPDLGIRTGFIIREPLTIEAALILIAWYGLIVAMAAIGFHAGRRIRLETSQSDSLALSRTSIYRIISIVAWVGVLASYYHITQVIGLSGIFNALARNTVNDLKTALYTDYSIGIYSLRYIAAIAGGLALFRFLDTGRPALFDVVNLLMLIGTSAISSRLSLIWAVITGLSVWAAGREEPLKAARWRLAALALTVVVILWTLNHSRNANYYTQRGTESVVASGLGEIRAYLGTPFQVALGVANHLNDALSGATSQYLVEWEVNLNSNSAFDQLIPTMGLFAFPYIAATSFFYSLLAGALAGLRRSYLFLGYPVILYAFAELWRIDLFRQGIFYTNMFAAIGLPLLIHLLTPRAISYTVIETVEEP